jgi:hypothetical protein
MAIFGLMFIAYFASLHGLDKFMVLLHLRLRAAARLP